VEINIVPIPTLLVLQEAVVIMEDVSVVLARPEPAVIVAPKPVRQVALGELVKPMLLNVQVIVMSVLPLMAGKHIIVREIIPFVPILLPPVSVRVPAPHLIANLALLDIPALIIPVFYQLSAVIILLKPGKSVTLQVQQIQLINVKNVPQTANPGLIRKPVLPVPELLIVWEIPDIITSIALLEAVLLNLLKAVPVMPQIVMAKIIPPKEPVLTILVALEEIVKAQAIQIIV